MRINYNKIIRKVLPFVYITLAAYSINSLLYIFLPTGIDISENAEEKNLTQYRDYKVMQAFNEKNKSIKKISPQKEYQLISNITLKAIYSFNSTEKGWIIIGEKSSNNTYILKVNETFKDYKLKELYSNYALFEKNSNEYKLDLDIRRTEKTSARSAALFSKEKRKEIKVNNKTKDFKITQYLKDTFLKNTELQTGDILKKINNIKLKKEEDIYRFFQNTDTVKTLTFNIIRDNQPMEIKYEIK